jgi:hypothetical protein
MGHSFREIDSSRVVQHFRRIGQQGGQPFQKGCNLGRVQHSRCYEQRRRLSWRQARIGFNLSFHRQPIDIGNPSDSITSATGGWGIHSHTQSLRQRPD